MHLIMDNFYEKNQMSFLKHTFEQNGVNTNTFFNLPTIEIQEILKHYSAEVVIKFISAYQFEKGLVHASINNNELIATETPIIQENIVIANNNDNDIANMSIEFIEVEDEARNSLLIVEPSAGLTETQSSDEFVFVENDLFNFLNSNLRGRIILGIYKKKRQLDRAALVDLVVMDRLERILNMNNFSVPTEVWLKLSQEIWELFPTEEKDLYYEPYRRSSTGDTVKARGSLYNHYTYIRGLLREAGLLDVDSNEIELQSPQEPKIIESDCLTNETRENYNSVDVITEWERTFPERNRAIESVQRSKKKSEPVYQIIIRSFPCLTQDIIITLLQSDFKKIFEDLTKKSKINPSIAQYCLSAFEKTWPHLSKSLIDYLSKRRNKDLKTFLSSVQHHIDKDEYISELALLCLPVFFNIPKSIQLENSKINISRAKISDSFILRVENISDVEAKKKEYEEFLTSIQQPVLPYIIWYGPFNNLKAYLIINGHQYDYAPIKAVEVCFHCLTAVHSWPFTCDYLWAFLQKYVYGIPCMKNYSVVTKTVTEIRTASQAQQK